MIKRIKYLCIFVGVLFPMSSYTNISFEHIKGRKIASFELADIILDLSLSNKIDLVDRWRDLSPSSFKGLNFTKSYLDAANRLLRMNYTNKAIRAYIKSYQYIDKETTLKVEAAFQTAMLLYAQQRRSEALFYVNRSIEQLLKLKDVQHPLAKDVFYLKRRIVWRYFSRLDSLPDNAISAVEFDGDDVWIGMWSGGLGRFSRSESVLQLFNNRNTAIPSNYIRDILVMKDKVWVATHSGLAYYDKQKSSWHQIPALKKYKLKTISFDKGYLYASTLFNGVFRSKDGEQWENIIASQSILDVLHSGDKIFIATPERGVYVYNNSISKRFLSNVSAKVIIEDTNPRYLWIGTYGSGLLKVDKSTAEIVEVFGKEELGSVYVESLLMVEGRLWIGTLEAGLSMYDLKKKTWTTLGLSEGLPGLDITTITRENDHIWLGTLAGGIGIYQFQ